MSQGSSGSPHLPANHRHVQLFAWGGEGGQERHPPGTPPSHPRSRPVPFLVPAGADITSSPQRSGSSPPGAGRHPPPPTPLPQTSPRWGSRQHCHGFPWLATVPGMCLAPGMALCQPYARKQRLPSPPARDAQPKASRAPSIACSSQALTDRQTDVGRLQPFLLLQHGRTRGAWTWTKYFLKSCST